MYLPPTSLADGCATPDDRSTNISSGCRRRDLSDLGLPALYVQVAMTWQHLIYDVEAGVAHIVLNRPERLNALGVGPGSNRQELVDALEQADADPEVGAIVISAAGRAFCAGGDMVGVPRSGAPLDDHLFIQAVDQANGRIRSISKPTVAAVQGLCLGTGLGLIAQFDFVVASDDARFGLIEGRTGHPGATEILAAVGETWAKFLILTGELIDARRAEWLGLVLAVVPAESLLNRCRDLATRLSRMPREATILNKAAVRSASEAMGRGAARDVGRARDTITRSMAFAARAPDGRPFVQILAEEGIAGLKRARDEQFVGSWLDPVPGI